jgi:hypothetical protein
MQDSKTLAIEDMRKELQAEGASMADVELDEWGKSFSSPLAVVDRA